MSQNIGKGSKAGQPVTVMGLLIPDEHRRLIDIHTIAMECWAAGFGFEAYRIFAKDSGNRLALNEATYNKMCLELSMQLKNLSEGNQS